ncbi:hypothetical protein N7G274_003135 [Stereocaulon virgatum]|uniref:G-protein coupled receptors family 2 profile 2 domain-containing protein n=1 Tax=Stereocaulon virgatum TaxID=373712 RepID=A0ABR4AGZ5_9LECA
MASAGPTLSSGQINALAVTERVTSILSLLGIFFILSTFLLGRGFNKPINRLVFAASWSNLGMNIAVLIAEDGVSAGQNSPLCQFQAFAIQMFLGVDALWALCMAFNVHLALFRGWTAERMQAQEWRYFMACYGFSFIPALTYLFINVEGHEKVYGPALLWCWITGEWDFLRIATLYGIVWIALTSAFVIYCMAGAKVWRNRHALREWFNPFNENPFGGTVTTRVEVTTHTRRTGSLSSAKRPSSREMPIPGVYFQGSGDYDPYTVNIEVGPKHERQNSAPELFRMRSLTRNAALKEANADAWLYARVAFLFFCALLISWVPSSINRVNSLAHPSRLNFGLNYVETLVLPLQGFLNAVVYVITSQTACRNLWRSITGGQELSRKSSSTMGVGSDVPLGMGKRDTKLERFAARRSSQRLECDVTSISSLRPH